MDNNEEVRMIKSPSLIQLDWTDLSEEAIKQFKEVLKRYNLHLGDAEEEYFGESLSSSFIMYVFHRKLTKTELEKYFKLEDDSKGDKKPNVKNNGSKR